MVSLFFYFIVMFAIIRKYKKKYEEKEASQHTSKTE